MIRKFCNQFDECKNYKSNAWNCNDVFGIQFDRFGAFTKIKMWLISSHCFSFSMYFQFQINQIAKSNVALCIFGIAYRESFPVIIFFVTSLFQSQCQKYTWICLHLYKTKIWFKTMKKLLKKKCSRFNLPIDALFCFFSKWKHIQMNRTEKEKINMKT